VVGPLKTVTKLQEIKAIKQKLVSTEDEKMRTSLSVFDFKLEWNNPIASQYRLTATIRMILKMFSAQDVETSVINNSSLRTTLTRTITQDEQLKLGSNHLL